MVTPSDRLLLADARAVIGTVPNHLFFVVIQRLTSAAAKAMAAIHKDLSSRLAEITCSVEEDCLSSQVVTTQVIEQVDGDLDQTADGLYRYPWPKRRDKRCCRPFVSFMLAPGRHGSCPGRVGKGG